MAITEKTAGRTRVLLILFGILAVSVGHYATPTSLFLWHNIFQRLYYLPIIFAAISFGWQGGLAAAAGAALCYFPHIVMAWHGHASYSASQYGEIVVFFLVGAITGVLSGRERKHRQELQRTAEQLRKVYSELQDSFEQLKRADRLSAIGQLAAGLAHEIRNPLASIEGGIDILEREPGSEDRRAEFLGIMKKECRRLNGLLTNLLDFARPRLPTIRQVDVKRLIDSVYQLLAHTADRNGIVFQRDVPEDLETIPGDEEQLQQVVLNLALNAVQAMEQGGTIVLRARRRGGQFAIEVIDEGSGIAESDLDKIFDPFYTTKESGTGLGLSVAHQIVSRHGGAIKVERNPDKGMTFTVLLPGG